MQDVDHTRLDLTDEAKQYVAAGSPEAQVFAAVPEDGLPLPELKVHVAGWRNALYATMHSL